MKKLNATLLALVSACLALAAFSKGASAAPDQQILKGRFSCFNESFRMLEFAGTATVTPQQNGFDFFRDDPVDCGAFIAQTVATAQSLGCTVGPPAVSPGGQITHDFVCQGLHNEVVDVIGQMASEFFATTP